MTSFDPSQALVIVEAVLRGPTGRYRLNLAVDTGSSVTLLSRAALMRTGHNPYLVTAATFFNTERSVPGYLIRIGGLEALGSTWENIDVVMHDLPAASGVDGLIGLDLMRGKRLTLDFRVGELTLD